MVSYISPIDPHVHLRGEEYSNVKPSFLELGFRDAKEVGLIGVLEQPNPRPELINRSRIKNRFQEVSAFSRGVYHGVHIGMTDNLDQVMETLFVVKNGDTGLNSDKTFYTHSTGNMGILDHHMQRRIWEVKCRMDYYGVSIGHFEDEKEFIGEFDYTKPISHSERQTPESELVQVERQIRNASDAGFKGVFYIAHVSNPDTVDYIDSMKENLPFRVVLEATFHHMFLNTSDYEIHGNRVKMNPPLRSPEIQEKILEYVLAGKFDVIGTDHAPHTLEKKDSDNPPSGIPALPFWPKGIELLRREGIQEDLLERLIFHNSDEIFKLGLVPKQINRNYNPDLWNAYGYNPFSRIDK